MGMDIDSELLKAFDKFRRFPLIFGIFPLKIKNYKLGVSIPGAVCTIFSLSLLLLCNLVQLLSSEPGNLSDDSPSQGIPFYVDYTILNLTVLIHLWSVLRGRNQILYILRIASKIKRSSEACGVSWISSQRLWVSVAHSIVFVSIDALDPLSNDASAFALANTFGYYIVVSLVLWVFSQFIWFCETIAECFRVLAECLQYVKTSGDVEFLIKLYFLASKAKLQLNCVYRLGLTLAFVSVFMVALSSTYETFFYIIHGGPMVSTFLWVLVMLLLFCRIIKSCAHVTYQAKRFDSLLYRLLVYKSPSNITNKNTTLKLFFHYCGKTEVDFTLSGFFKLDWHLLYSMLAAGCTYLIIIIQMNSLGSHEKSTGSQEMSTISS